MKQLFRSLSLVATILGSGMTLARTEDRVPAVPAAFASPELQARLSAGVSSAGERLVDLESLRLLYARRGHRPVWSAGGNLSPQVDDLLATLRLADREGLHPVDYHIAAIDSLLARQRPAAVNATHDASEPAPGDMGDLDLLLSDAFFLYASHLTAGRVNPTSVEPAWNISGRGRDLGLLLGAALDNGHLARTLRELPPVREDYRLLRDALATQRAVAAGGGWPLVPWGRTLREGDRSPRVAALRRRLAATGELAAGSDTTSELFDAPLADALRRFQVRHGIEVDAVAGKRTLSELNAPATRRTAQIEANLERLRWLPRELGPRHILVNVADFRLVLTEGGAQTLTMRVIAGRQARRTPFFTGEITSILFNPSWTVPEKIALEDKLPLIIDDPDFLENHGFRVFERSGKSWREIDPSEMDFTRISEKHFPYRLRQDPGPKNALGRVKFQVPNRHDIYLHDTPSRGLFTRAERMFSSGCVRVERAVDLAERLLAADPAWPRARIEAAIATGDTESVRLPEPVPVYLLYWTAWIDRDGVLQFRHDVYGRDAALFEALARPLTVR